MEYTLSKHALIRLKARNISVDKVSHVLHEPDSVVVRMNLLPSIQNLSMKAQKLIFIGFINTTKNPFIVITAYKPSKLQKYGNQIQ